MSEIVTATTPLQIEQVRCLFREYRAELPLELCFGRFEDELRELPGEYAQPRGLLLLATVVGQPVACVGLRPFPVAGTCEMKRLYVRPPFRAGQLGRAIVARLLNEARGLEYRDVRLDTHPSSMAAAVKLYRQLGFQEVPADPLKPVEGLLYMQRGLDSVSL